MAYVCTMSLFLVNTVLFIQQYKVESRYCKEAVDSVKIVKTCPNSSIEWENAALKKDCSKIALQQNCSSVKKFQYHCVINGYRNETLEVCAPSRIIFGHCVEFNEPGGVIQDQISAPCNETFPKCDDIYQSSTAYKYPDCYQLVSKRDILHTLTTTATDEVDIPMSTPAESTLSHGFFSPSVLITSGIVLVALIYTIFYFCGLFNKKLTTIFNRKKDNRQKIETKMAESRSLIQTPVEQNQTRDASNANSDDPGVLQSDDAQEDRK